MKHFYIRIPLKVMDDDGNDITDSCNIILEKPVVFAEAIRRYKKMGYKNGIATSVMQDKKDPVRKIYVTLLTDDAD